MTEKATGGGPARDAGRPEPSVPGTRGRVLAAIRSAASEPTVEDLSETLEVHPNTVRFHTSALLEEGLVQEGRRAARGRGRPRTTYRPTALGTRSGQRNYQLLATVLIDRLAQGRPRSRRIAEARAAGRSWGHRITPPTASSALDATVELLDEMGFEPDPTPDARAVRLHNCPFRELVDTHAELVCALHAGMLDGLAEQHSGPGQPVGATLLPFAEPTCCRVDLHED